MKAAARLWLLPILVLFGMLCGYAQLGSGLQDQAPRTTQAARGAPARQTLLLQAEMDCRPWLRPCIARAGPAVLLLQAQPLRNRGEWVVVVGQMGFPTSALDGAELILAPLGARNAYRAVFSAGGWKAVLPLDDGIDRLDVLLRDDQRVWRAGFPLAGSSSDFR